MTIAIAALLSSCAGETEDPDIDPAAENNPPPANVEKPQASSDTADHDSAEQQTTVNSHADTPIITNPADSSQSDDTTSQTPSESEQSLTPESSLQPDSPAPYRLITNSPPDVQLTWNSSNNPFSTPVSYEVWHNNQYLASIDQPVFAFSLIDNPVLASGCFRIRAVAGSSASEMSEQSCYQLASSSGHCHENIESCQLSVW